MGPSLAAAGMTNVLADPVIELRNSGGTMIGGNDNWRDTQASQIQGTVFEPTDDREAVLMITLQPGAYTVVMFGKNQTTGVGLVEIYDNNQQLASELGNISTRGFVQTGNGVMIGGFMLGGNDVSSNIAIRGLGPSLSQSGLGNVLADPTLELRDQNGTMLVSNDNWQDNPAAAAQLTAHGLALPDAHESGIFTSLPIGPYTAILAGLNNGTGVGLVEIYNVH